MAEKQPNHGRDHSFAGTSKRREFIAAGAAGVFAAVAGCTELGGDEPIESTAAFAAPADEALRATGFEKEVIEKDDLEEALEIGDQIEQEVRATYWVAMYTRAVEMDDVPVEMDDVPIDNASFAAVSTPSVDVLGEEQNPIADLDAKKLVERLQDRFEYVEHAEHQDSYELEILGQKRTVDVFHATADVDGTEAEAVIELASFSHEDDVLVLSGSHLRAFHRSDFEYDTLMASVEHPTDPPEDYEDADDADEDDEDETEDEDDEEEDETEDEDDEEEDETEDEDDENEG